MPLKHPCKTRDLRGIVPLCSWYCSCLQFSLRLDCVMCPVCLPLCMSTALPAPPRPATLLYFFRGDKALKTLMCILLWRKQLISVILWLCTHPVSHLFSWFSFYQHHYLLLLLLLLRHRTLLLLPLLQKLSGFVVPPHQLSPQLTTYFLFSTQPTPPTYLPITYLSIYLPAYLSTY